MRLKLSLRSLIFLSLLTLSACAAKPPVQEMAEARSALETAKKLEGGNSISDQQLKSAEKALSEAASAMEKKRFDAARWKAVDAKRKAQKAAEIKQKTQ